jgi:Abnormal spindle-like microcephaly-assoc'd, ASPM-SPD-2-Hydin
MYPRGSLHIHHRPARRMLTALAGLALTLGALPALTGAVPGTRTAIARADDQTAALNTMRTGWDSNESAMTPSLVKTFSSAPRFSDKVIGQVYAQPLVIDSLNVVIVATEEDWVYGIQATGTGAGTVRWSKHLGTPFNISKDTAFARCTDLVPYIGVTGTPAYSDPATGGTGDIYLFATVVNGTPAGVHTYMFGITPVAVGSAPAGSVVQQTRIQGKPSNDSHITFNSTMQMSRPGVLLSGGAVWGAFASHCDHKPYAGYVARVPIGGTTPSLWTDESGLTYNRAGIWHGGSGLMQDPQGRIFVASGNGVSPAKASTPPGQLAESVIRLSYSSSTGHISARDFFSPANAPSLDAADTDFGSGGPVGVPFSTSGTSNFLVQAGKDGRIFLLDRSHLGGREQGSGNSDNVLFQIKSAGGEWGHPALFYDTDPLTAANASTAHNFLVYVGKDADMQVFKFGVASSGKPTLSYVAHSSLVYGYTSGSPQVTSSSTDLTSAVIWVVQQPSTTTKTGVNSILTAYALGDVTSACKSSSLCKLTPIWTSTTFTSAKFSTPATSNGWVYVGTRDSRILGWAAPTTTAPVLGSAASLAQTPIGSTSSGNVTITAKHPVTVNTVTVSTSTANSPTPPGSQFSVNSVTENGGTTAVTLPVTLAKGDKLTAHVTFAPADPGTVAGTVSFATSSGADPTVDVPVLGDGSQAGLIPEPGTAVAFPLAPDQGVADVPVGITRPEVVTITNFGTTTEKITSVTPPAAPFSATGLPKPGDKIKPGGTIIVQLNFAPTAPGAASGSFTIAGNSGPPATVSLSGSGAAPVSQFTAANPVVKFGTIKVGKKATAYVYISNTGNTASTVQGTSTVPTPFATSLKPPSGLPFNPDSDMAVPVTFTPSKKGTFTTPYTLTWNDVNGSHTLTVTLTGTAA